MIGVIDYGMGNIQSVVNALEYLGEKVKTLKTGGQLAEVDKIILPGVGAFGEGIKNLNRLGLTAALNIEVLEKKKPFLGICLGMQLICKESYEFGHHAGLSWIDASVRRFEENLNLPVPHVGWNDLVIKKPNQIIVEE